MAKGSVYDGKTYDDAVRKGLENLGLARAEATITVIEEGKGGFLGFGARPFKVSIMRRPGGAVREPEETKEHRVSSNRRDDRRGGRGGRDRDSGGRDKGKREGSRAEGGRPEGGRGDGGRSEGGRSEGGRSEGGRGEKQAAPRAEAPRVEAPRAEGGRPEGGRAEGGRGEGGRGGRGGRRGEKRDGKRDDKRDDKREERRPLPAQSLPPAEIEVPVTAASAHANGADNETDAESMRRRRRRGRRGGRGRRRGNAAGGANEELALGDDVVSTHDNGASEDFEMDSREDAPSVAAPVAAVSAPIAAAPPVPAAPVEPAYAPVAASAAAPVAVAAASTASSQDLATLAIAKSKEFFTMMGFDAQVTAKADGTRVDVTVEVGKDDDLLTGVRGETRAALEHLLNRFINTGEGSRYHLQLEINDFWLRREEELATQAREMAEKALATHAEVVTELMNSQERRIIHVTLKEDSRVKTYSLGTDRSKRVAIAPADFPDRSDEELAG